MKKLILMIAMSAAALCCAQTPGTPTPGPGNDAGLLYASNFGLWSVPQGNTGQFSWSSPALCTVTANGIALNPVFALFTPIEIKDQNPANSEVVTPTAVNVGGAGCSIVVSPANPHNTFVLESATAGLQEAINYAHGLPYEIVLTPDWTRLGGTTPEIVNAHGNFNVTIIDERTSTFAAYTWNGLIYVAGSISGGAVVTVNGGAPLPLANFNNATPAADAGFENIDFQQLGGNVSAEIPYGSASTLGVLECGSGTICIGGVVSIPLATSSTPGIVECGSGTTCTGGVISVSAATSPGGLNGQPQYNNAGSFGGISPSAEATVALSDLGIPTYSILNYGAVTNTDSTAAIVATEAAINSSGLPGILLIPPGNYIISSTVTISSSNTIITGGGILECNLNAICVNMTGTRNKWDHVAVLPMMQSYFPAVVDNGNDNEFTYLQPLEGIPYAAGGIVTGFSNIAPGSATYTNAGGPYSTTQVGGSGTCTGVTVAFQVNSSGNIPAGIPSLYFNYIVPVDPGNGICQNGDVLQINGGTGSPLAQTTVFVYSFFSNILQLVNDEKATLSKFHASTMTNHTIETDGVYFGSDIANYQNVLTTAGSAFGGTTSGCAIGDYIFPAGGNGQDGVFQVTATSPFTAVVIHPGTQYSTGTVPTYSTDPTCSPTLTISALGITGGSAASILYFYDNDFSGNLANPIDWSGYGNEIRGVNNIFQDYSQYAVRSVGTLTLYGAHAEEGSIPLNPQLNGAQANSAYLMTNGGTLYTDGNGYTSTDSLNLVSTCTVGTPATNTCNQDMVYYVIARSATGDTTLPMQDGSTQAGPSIYGSGNSVAVIFPTIPAALNCDVLRVNQTTYGAVNPFGDTTTPVVIAKAIPCNRVPASGTASSGLAYVDSGPYVQILDTLTTPAAFGSWIVGTGNLCGVPYYMPQWYGAPVLLAHNTTFTGSFPNTLNNFVNQTFCGPFLGGGVATSAAQISITGSGVVTNQPANNFTGVPAAMTNAPAATLDTANVGGALATGSPAQILEPFSYNGTTFANGANGVIVPVGNSQGLGDIMTLFSTNPQRIWATPGGRAPANSGDTAIGVDTNNGTFSNGYGLFLRDQSHICNYINTFANGTSWLECLTSTAKTFKVPITDTFGFTGPLTGNASTATNALEWNGTNISGSPTLGLVPTGQGTTAMWAAPAAGLPVIEVAPTSDILCAHGSDITIASIAITGSSGTASPYTFTFAGGLVESDGYVVGQNIQVNGATPGTLNVKDYIITSVNSTNSITATTATGTGTWASGGTMSMVCNNTTDAIGTDTVAFASTLTLAAMTTFTEYKITDQFGLFAPLVAGSSTLPNLTYNGVSLGNVSAASPLKNLAVNIQGSMLWTVTSPQSGVLYPSFDAQSISTSYGNTNSFATVNTATSSSEPLTLKFGWTAAGLGGTLVLTYASGGTACTNGTQTVGTFNGAGTAGAGTITVTGGIPSGAVTFTNTGYGYTSIPTTGQVATCTGVTTFTSTGALGGAQGAALRLLMFSAKQQ